MDTECGGEIEEFLVFSSKSRQVLLLLKPLRGTEMHVYCFYQELVVCTVYIVPCKKRYW